MLVMDLDLIDSNMLMITHVCTPVLLYTHPIMGVRGPAGPQKSFSWDICWPTIYGHMVLGDPWYFPMVIPLYKESIVIWLCIVSLHYKINLYDCVRETVRE